MTIIHVIEPFAAGIATFTKLLTELTHSDQHIIVHGEREEIISSNKLRTSFPSNTTFINWKNAQREISFLKDSRAFVELFDILRFQKFDIVHLHSSKAGFLGRIACRILDIKNVIYSPHCGSFIRSDISDTKRVIFSKLERFANRFSGVVICSSKSEYHAFERAGIVAKYIFNGTSIKRSNSPKTKNSSNAFRIASCGNITFQKNPEMFNSIAKHFENDPSIEFVWIGEGKEREKLTASNIRITGWLSKEDVFKELEQTQCYLSCSLWEGLSYAVLEAMTAKNALLLTNCIGNIDVIEDGKNGYHIESIKEAIDKIDHLSKNLDLAIQMGEHSHTKCFSSFNADECMHSYRKEYEHLISI